MVLERDFHYIIQVKHGPKSKYEDFEKGFHRPRDNTKKLIRQLSAALDTFGSDNVRIAIRYDYQRLYNTTPTGIIIEYEVTVSGDENYGGKERREAGREAA